jgi:hypothetical protein
VSTIVAIRTPDVVVMAADSAATCVGGQGGIRAVCKIRPVGDGRFFAVAGLTEDPERGFSATAIVRDALVATAGVVQSAPAVAEALRGPLVAELGRLEAEDPEVLRRTLDGRLPSALIVGVEDGVPAAVSLGFEVPAAANWSAGLTLRTTGCPGDCPNGTYTFVLGARSAIDAYTAQHGTAMGMSPEDGAYFLVALEVDAGTEGVAGPVDAVRIAADGYRWLQLKSGCA